MSTDLVVRYSLPGLIAYARMGGDVRKITDSNVSEVGRIMGRDVYRYSYPLLNLNELLGVHVLNLIKQFSDPKQASTFLTDALN